MTFIKGKLVNSGIIISLGTMVVLFHFSAFSETMKPLPSSGKVELTLGASGKMPTTIYVPEGTGIKPLILVIHSSGGLKGSVHKYAKALTKEGYISVVPDFFTAYDITPRTKRLTWTEYRDDINKDFTTIISQVKSLSKTPSKKVFAVGFSNGGYWAAALAAQGDIDAGISYYGAYTEGGTVRRNELEDGSILYNAGSNSAPLLMFHGTDDNTVGLESAEAFEALYPNVDAYYYDDVEHSFNVKFLIDVYNEEAAKDSWEKTLKFLKEHSE